MVNRLLPWMIAALSGAGALCCQQVAGITDRDLDPAWNQPSTSGTERRPPERVDGGVNPEGGVSRLFGAHAVFLGTINPDTRKADTAAWKRLGFDVDGKCTTQAQSESDSTGVCKKPAGAQADSLVDGDACRDNSGGKLLNLGAMVLAGDFELSLNKKLQLSQMPMMVLALEDLGDGPDDPYVPGAIYITVPAPDNPPLWGGKDEVWVDPSCLTAGDLKQPRYASKTGYLKNNVWVSGDFNSVPGPMPLMVFDGLVEVNPLMMVITAQLNTTHDAVIKSMASAVLDTEEVKRSLGPVFYQMTGCSQTQADMIMNQFVLPNADLAAVAYPFVAADQVCNAMSWGLGIEWLMIRSVLVAGASPPKPSACDAGAD